MISFDIARVKDLSEKENSVLIITKDGFFCETMHGKVVRKNNKNFVSGRISFGSGTIALEDGEIPKSILLLYRNEDEDLVQEIARKIRLNNVVIDEKMIPDEGYEFILKKWKLIGIFQTVRMIRKMTRGTDIWFQLVYAPKSLDNI